MRLVHPAANDFNGAGVIASVRESAAGVTDVPAIGLKGIDAVFIFSERRVLSLELVDLRLKAPDLRLKVTTVRGFAYETLTRDDKRCRRSPGAVAYRAVAETPKRIKAVIGDVDFLSRTATCRAVIAQSSLRGIPAIPGRTDVKDRIPNDGLRRIWHHPATC